MKNKKLLIIVIIIISILFIIFKINKLNILLFYIWIYIYILGIISFSPYIIGIAISAIIIFLIRKKLNEKNKNFKIFIYSIIIILCVIVCRNAGYSAIQYLSEKPDEIYSKMKELNDSEKLIGLSKEEVIELLGEPQKSSDDNRYIYNAGTLTNYLLLGDIEHYDLFIWFDENDIVKSTKIDLPPGG